MAYYTPVFLFVFLPIVLLLYQLTPQKYRFLTLLLAGYVFFWSFSGKLLLILIATTFFTYSIGVWMLWLRGLGEKEVVGLAKKEANAMKKEYKKKEKSVLIFGITVVVGVLIYLKYYNFFVTSANELIKGLGGELAFRTKRMLIPIGISFYTLQAVSYMADVYWEKITVLKHPGKLALFLSFFPQIMEGPISLHDQTADQLWEGKDLKKENLSAGAVRILWGLFKKMLIADRLYVIVQEIFEHDRSYHGVMIAVAAIAYTVQLYMEFSGCMDIILGVGRMFGVMLPENFCQPFASKNAAEFWRRWHITLGVWFKTYIFYPISVSGMVKKWNKFGKKHVGKHATKVGVSALCLFPVWFCNGLWHGASFSYMFYGMYYFVILLAAVALEPVREWMITTFHLKEEALYYRIPQRLKTWVIIFVGELFFRANGLKAGMRMFFHMFQSFELHKLWDGTLLQMGLDGADWLVIVVGCLVVGIVGSIREHQWLKGGIPSLALPVRWAIYYALIFAVLIFGAYGIGYQQVDMIYANF